MTVALVLQAPVRIILVIAKHDDHSVFGILRDDPDNGVPLQIQPLPQIPGQFFVLYISHILYAPEFPVYSASS